MADKNFKWFPDAEHRFFLCDPSSGEFMFFKTTEQRDYAAHDMIQAHLDECWSEDVDRIVAGVVTHHTIKTNVQPCPKREDFFSDQDFEEALDDFGGDEHAFTCDYKLAPIAGSGGKQS